MKETEDCAEDRVRSESVELQDPSMGHEKPSLPNNNACDVPTRTPREDESGLAQGSADRVLDDARPPPFADAIARARSAPGSSPNQGPEGCEVSLPNTTSPSVDIRRASGEEPSPKNETRSSPGPANIPSGKCSPKRDVPRTQTNDLGQRSQKLVDMQADASPSQTEHAAKGKDCVVEGHVEDSDIKKESGSTRDPSMAKSSEHAGVGVDRSSNAGCRPRVSASGEGTDTERASAPVSKPEAPVFRTRGGRARSKRRRTAETEGDARTADDEQAQAGSAKPPEQQSVNATESHEDGHNEENLLRRDARALRIAQQLRDAGRFQRLRSSADEATLVPGSSFIPDRQEESVTGGLRSNFAVESSGYDAQRQMEEFVESKMVEKFGPRYSAQQKASEVDGRSQTHEIGGSSSQPETKSADAELYTVPEHLRVAPRLQYDPSEGLPAAGVEEVDIGAEARLRNEEQTAIARKRMLDSQQKQRAVADGKRSSPTIVGGNVSSNFEKHRRDWIATHVARDGQGGQSRGRGKREATGNRRGGHTGKRTAATGLATDHIIADRFRKRWRR